MDRLRTITLMKESQVLVAVCLADLLATLLLVGRHHASEGNPLMAYYLSMGLGTFVLVKLGLVILPIFVVEYSKQFAPRFARNLVRLAIVAYVGTYLLLFLGVNVKPILAEKNERPPMSSAQMVN